MRIEVKIPRVSLEDKKGVLNQWYRKDGDYVKEGEEIAEIMIEKTRITVKAPASGKLKIITPRNEEISQEQVIAYIETS